jgi:hypothetical protein
MSVVESGGCSTREAAVISLVPALFSFAFFKCARSVFGSMLSAHLKKHPAQAKQWRLLSGESLKMPIALPVVMTTAPRWNPHALIATLGPLPVKQDIRIHVDAADRSANAWTIVLYSMPDRDTVTSVGSIDGPAPGGWRTIPLKPGLYGLAVRYYGWKSEIELPKIDVDGSSVVQAQPHASASNDFYKEIKDRRGIFYSCLHYYVYPMLKYRHWLPPDFVERQYLPVGNPETEFFYGILRAGERLRMETDVAVLRSFAVYLTIYNRASFPIVWYAVIDAVHTTSPVLQKASYLVRIHKSDNGAAVFDRKRFCVTTV